MSEQVAITSRLDNLKLLPSSLKPELIADNAREAHRRGLSLTGHIPRGMDVRRAIESGMD